MKKEVSEAILADSALLLDGCTGHRPSAIEMAIFIEDNFDIILGDAEIVSRECESPEGVRRLVERGMES
jgi:hypothetical protein